MILIQVDCLDCPEYVLLREGQAVAGWSAEEAWGSFVKNLLERLDHRVEVLDGTPAVASFLDALDDDLDWTVTGLIERVAERFGVAALARPLSKGERKWLLTQDLMGKVPELGFRS